MAGEGLIGTVGKVRKVSPVIGAYLLGGGGGTYVREVGGDGGALLVSAVPRQLAQQHVEAGQDRWLRGAVAQWLGHREVEEFRQGGATQYDANPAVVVSQNVGGQVTLRQLAQQRGGVGERVDRGGGVVDAGGERWDLPVQGNLPFVTGFGVCHGVVAGGQ